MKYFSERNNLRTTMDFSDEITYKNYKIIYELCENYFDNIAWKFPIYTGFAEHISGINMENLNDFLELEIPNLYRNGNGDIAVPTVKSKFDQFALLDFIEFIILNCKDIAISSIDFYGVKDFYLKNGNTSKLQFKSDINNLFYRLGLLYELNDDNLIDRVVVTTPLSQELELSICNIQEQSTKDLLLEAIRLFKQPHPSARQNSVEKIWDALERLKTYYYDLDKKNSANQIVEDMSAGQAEFKELFELEFKALTTIGNNFRIRHHETNKTDIIDPRHYDYFFNRCLSLIALAIQYLK